MATFEQQSLFYSLKGGHCTQVWQPHTFSCSKNIYFCSIRVSFQSFLKFWLASKLASLSFTDVPESCTAHGVLALCCTVYLWPESILSFKLQHCCGYFSGVSLKSELLHHIDQSKIQRFWQKYMLPPPPKFNLTYPILTWKICIRASADLKNLSLPRWFTSILCNPACWFDMKLTEFDLLESAIYCS